MITDNLHRSAMTQTISSLTLAGMATTRGHEPFTGFSIKGKGLALLPYVPGGGGRPSGSGSGGPPGRGPPGGGGGGLPGGRGAFPAAALGVPAGGGGKLGGNPPRVFDGTCSEADIFMNEFNLYCLTNIGADPVNIPMKRAALLFAMPQRGALVQRVPQVQDKERISSF